MNQIENNEVNNTASAKDEISLIDLLAVLLKHKWMIIITTVIGMIGVLVVSIISLVLPPEKSFLPNVYTPQAQMLINDEGQSSSMGNLSSLASLAGVNMGGGGASNSALALYLVNSNTVQDAVVDKFNFIEEWEIEKHPRAESRKALKEKLASNYDEDSGIFTISFKDKDPVLARDVVNFVVDLIEQRFNELGVDKNKLQKANLEENINNAYAELVNLQKQSHELESSVSNVYSANNTRSIVMDTTLLRVETSVQEEVYKQLKAQYESLKVTMASEKPVFQILEYAEIPDQKSGPSRGKLCIIVTFAAFFLSVFLAFLKNAIENIKKDPEAMGKLNLSGKKFFSKKS
ncbi:MAG: lipopolysaccharide biosynthesis protein [Treponema sp.]|nr:lipopolysaccharide biosynthesis protein [Treponema sp.]